MTDQATPAPPSTPAEAATCLSELAMDANWSAALLKGNSPQVKEMNNLIALKSSGDKVDRIIAGTAETSIGELNVGGISTANAMRSAAWLKEAGISDGAIKEAFEGKPVTREVFNAVKQLQAERHGDAAWVAKLLSGDYAAKRDEILMNIVLISPVKDAPDEI